MKTQIEFFKKIAENENGKLYLHDKDISFGDGTRSPNVIFKIKFEYKSNQFTIVNQTGTNYVGTISCKLSNDLQPIPFEIDTISHLKNLFLRRKSRFVLKSENQNVLHFLKTNNALNLLSEIADKEDFRPLVVCSLDGYWSIVCKYHLEFDDWTQVIEPIIALYKNLIDEFEKRIANINHGQYRELNS
ncbi:hypothetical protein [uncultured Aquimarina sp.]|uniref:hypothetical protein n=1 Tax=uncultured Aquimarina sp. TaxID=575652 RepID=UPI002624F762|nr:hypothetical protein [uncultured Aquimarina sp.]